MVRTTDLRSQREVTAHLKSKQLPSFGFAQQNWSALLTDWTITGRMGQLALIRKSTEPPLREITRKRDHYCVRYPANTRRSLNVGTMLGQRRRRWPSIVPTLSERLVFTGYHPTNTRHWPSVDVMLGQRRRRWTIFTAAFGQCLVFAGQQKLDV